MAKVFLSAGHGGYDPGAVGNGLLEKDINLEIMLACRDELRRNGVEVVTSRTTDEDDPVQDEVREANASGADVAVSFHTNAGGGDGSETYYYGGDSEGKRLAQLLEQHAGAIGQNSRGAKDGSGLMFINSTSMTAALVECAFIDNATDVQAVDEIAEQRAFGVAYAHAVMEFCGIEASDAPAAPTQPEAPAAGGGSGFEGGLYRCMVDVLNVRSAPSLGGAVVAQYRRGETVTLDSWYTVADGYVWGRYTSYSGYTRYIAVGLPTGAPAADDYLLKV